MTLDELVEMDPEKFSSCLVLAKRDELLEMADALYISGTEPRRSMKRLRESIQTVVTNLRGYRMLRGGEL